MDAEKQIALVLEVLDSADSCVKRAKRMLADLCGSPLPVSISKAASGLAATKITDEGKIVEGVFTGERMQGSDGEDYPVPANYASKSKLVFGDVLKLTIADDGRFLYKQIGPVDRKTVIGTLVADGSQFKVIADGGDYRVLLASVTYFKAEVGDKVTLIVPDGQESEWGAIEAVLPSDVGEQMNLMDDEPGVDALGPEEDLEFGL
jgi:hypothetical protein